MNTEAMHAGHPVLAGSAVHLRELTGVTLLRLHSLQPITELREAIKPCEVSLPGRVNQCLGEDPAVLCVAPGEWLLFSEFQGGERLLRQIEPLINGHLTALLNTSAALAVFRLTGSSAPWLLSKLSGLDFHRAAAAGAHCARTRLQHAAVTIHYHLPAGGYDEYVFDLILDRSIAAWLWQLLIASIPHAEHLNHSYGAGT